MTDTPQFTFEELMSVAAFIRSVEFAQRTWPEMQIRQLGMCGCMGAQPGFTECPCVLRRKGVNSFMEKIGKARKS